MALASGCGAQLEISSTELPLQRLLFAEGGARVLVTVPAAELEAFAALSEARGFPQQSLGYVHAKEELQLRLAGEEVFSLDLKCLEKAYQEAIPRRLASHLLGHTG
jgi:phosphoribosylformylglycinamidine synthase